jgi:Subtilase family
MPLRRISLAIAIIAMPAAAQLSVPPVGQVIDSTLRKLPGELGGLGSASDSVVRSAAELAQARLDRSGDLVRRNRPTIERDALGNPARRGELLIVDFDPASLSKTAEAGYRLIEQGKIDGVDIGFSRMAVPNGLSLAKAERDLKQRLPNSIISADQLLFVAGKTKASGDARVPSSPQRGGTVGIIDSGAGENARVTQRRGFATGAPAAAAHGTAIVSLLVDAGVERILVADVYGSDPAGGNALAVARALGWMTALRVPVVSISLTGPDNPLLARTIAAAGARGTIVVAAVGNDGPAAPPTYPASYPEVIAVTGVDGHNRALIEAGRALHLDYAAPGADMVATGLNGRPVRVRGTSFATPLVAARIAAGYLTAPNRPALLRTIDAAAIDLGPKGPDRSYGRGLVCGECRRTK